MRTKANDSAPPASAEGKPSQAAAANATPRRVVRTIYMFLVWLFVAGIVLQVTLIGFGLFYTPDAKTYLDAHAMVGWTLAHNFAPIILVLGFFAKLGKKLLAVHIVRFALTLVLPILATLREDQPAVAALHPFVAIAIFALALYLAARARQLVPTPWGTAPLPGASAPPAARA